MLRGHLDHASRQCIQGWAYAGSPDRPAQVQIHIDGELVARLTANQMRDDLAATLGSTRHGFELVLPGLCALRRHVVSVRIDSDEHELHNSPIIIEAADAFGDEVEASLSRLVAAADLASLDRGALALSDLIDTILDRRAALACDHKAQDLNYRWFARRDTSVEERSPKVAKRALVVAPSDPLATMGMDGFLLCDRAASLRRLGFEVAVAAADLEPLAAEQSAFLKALRIELPRRPYTATIEELLRREKGLLDVVLLVGIESARRYLALANGLCPSARVVFVATIHDLACLDLTATMNGRARWLDDALESDRYLSILPKSKTGTLDPRKVVVSWSQTARPGRASFQRRMGVVVLDDPALMPPILVELLTAALGNVRARLSTACVIWRNAPPPGCKGDPVWSETTAIADLAELARVAVTLRATPAAYRDVAACFAAGLPCVAAPDILRDLGLPAALVAADISSAEVLAAAILRLHEDMAHNTNVRKRSLDEIDMRHAPADSDAALKLALRVARGALRRDIAVKGAGAEARVC